MRKLIFLISALTMVALLACSEQKQEKQMTEEKAMEAEATYAAWNTVCPVQGEEVKNTVPTVEYNGKAYGFCCEGCDKKFAEHPEAFAKNLSEDGTKFLDPEKQG